MSYNYKKEREGYSLTDLENRRKCGLEVIKGVPEVGPPFNIAIHLKCHICGCHLTLFAA